MLVFFKRVFGHSKLEEEALYWMREYLHLCVRYRELKNAHYELLQRYNSLKTLHEERVVEHEAG